MRYVLIFFSVSLLFFGILTYLVDSLEVIDPEKLEMVRDEYDIKTNEEFYDLFDNLKDTGLVYSILNQNNLHAIMLMIFLFSSTTFTSAHLFIDKMFFKCFYEQPIVSDAVRRSIFISFIITSFFYLKIFALLSFITGALLVIIFGLMEVLYTKYKSTRIHEDFPNRMGRIEEFGPSGSEIQQGELETDNSEEE